MTIDELIIRLQVIRAERGDLPVYTSCDDYGHYEWEIEEVAKMPENPKYMEDFKGNDLAFPERVLIG